MQQEEDAAQPLNAEQHIQRNMKILQAQQVTIDAAQKSTGGEAKMNLQMYVHRTARRR
jgi:hypothetical protein